MSGEGKLGDWGEAEEEVENGGKDGRVDGGFEQGAQLGSLSGCAEERRGRCHGEHLAVGAQEVHHLAQESWQFESRHLFPE